MGCGHGIRPQGQVATAACSTAASEPGGTPIHSGDVAAAVGRTAVGTPVNGVVEVAGPDTFRLDELIRKALADEDDPRTVVADPHAPYCGAELQETTLLPGADAHLAKTRFADWAAQQ